MAVVHFCWRCYGDNDAAAGACRHCGGSIEAPADATYLDQLLWALDHPLPERRMVAARVLGERRERRAVRRLRELAAEKDDPYLAAASLQALIGIAGTSTLRDLLERLAAGGPPQVRAVAEAALSE